MGDRGLTASDAGSRPVRVEFEKNDAISAGAWLGLDAGAACVSLTLAVHYAFEVGARIAPCRVPDVAALALDPTHPAAGLHAIAPEPTATRPDSLLITFAGHAYGSSPSEPWVATLTLARGAELLLCEDVAHAGGSAAAAVSTERLPVRFLSRWAPKPARSPARFETAITAGPSALHGDEVVILERLHPRWACLPLRLPARAPAVRLVTNTGASRAIELAWYALHLDGDAERCWLVFHGSARVDDATDPDALVLRVNLETPRAEWARPEQRVRAPAPACGPSIHEVIDPGGAS